MIARSKIPFRGLTGFSGTLRVVWDTSKPNGQPRRTLRVDTSRVEREFGFKSRTSFEEGLRRTAEWHAGRMDPATTWGRVRKDVGWGSTLRVDGSGMI
jgi:hypothetical protein